MWTKPAPHLLAEWPDIEAAFATVLQRPLVTDLTITASVARILSWPRDYYGSWL